MKKILQGEQLIERAKQLGVDLQGERIYQSSSGRAKVDDYELQRRIIEADRSIRESRLWIVAVISAAASVISALTALIALTHH